MPGLDKITIFAGAAVLFAVFPGPAVFYIVTRSTAQGRLAGLVSALGIETGNLVHVAAATLGLSALLASSAMAFATLKYLGAAYLVYLGVRTLLDRGEADHSEPSHREPLRRLYAHGALVATLNPKTALFFLAFLPQFVDTAAGPIPLQVGFLGVLLVAVTTVSDTLYALLAGTAGTWLRSTAAIRRSRRIVSGGVYIALGLTAAFAGARSASK